MNKIICIVNNNRMIMKIKILIYKIKFKNKIFNYNNHKILLTQMKYKYKLYKLQKMKWFNKKSNPIFKMKFK